MSKYSEIKIGDTVVVLKAFDSSFEKQCKVEKVSQTTFSAGGYTFNKSSGALRGARYASTYVR